MGSDCKLVVGLGARSPQDICNVLKHHEINGTLEGTWVWADLENFDEALAKKLSKRLSTTVVLWTIHTQVELIWLQCFVDGKCTRQLLYSADEGWELNEGSPLPFENTPALQAWLETENVMASPDGYDVLDAFLGTHLSTYDGAATPAPTDSTKMALSKRIATWWNTWLERYERIKTSL